MNGYSAPIWWLPERNLTSWLTLTFLILKAGEGISNDSQDIPKVLNKVSKYDNVLKVTAYQIIAVTGHSWGKDWTMES